MALINAEYRVNLTPSRGEDARDAANVFAVLRRRARHGGRPRATRSGCAASAFGFGAAGLRVEFGFRANDIPDSRQILVRFSPTF